MRYEEFKNKSSLSKMDLLAISKGNFVDDPPQAGLARLPSPPFLMFDRVVSIKSAPRDGRIVAEQDITPDAWYFQCHFVGDPVQPGCLGVDAEYGAAVTTHMSAPLRFSVLKSVAEIRIDDLDILDELDEQLVELETAFNKRNDLVHNQWARNPDTGDVFTVKEKARTRYEMDLIPMSIDGVKSDALFIYQTGMNFMTFLMTNGLLPPVPSGHPRSHKSKAVRKKRRS